MLPKGIKFAYAALMAASVIMAFIVVRNFDEGAVAGPSYVITFHRTDGGASGPRIAEMVDRFARDHRVNIGRLYSDPRNESVRRVYLAVGNPDDESTSWIEEGYPNFSREANVEMRPYQEIVNVHPDGLYYVYGSHAAATALLTEFAKLGYYGQTEPLLSPTRAVEYFGQGALLWCFVVVGFITMLAVSSAVTLNAKSYGIQRLNGRPFAKILGTDLLQVATSFAGTTASVWSATVIFLYFYNGLNRFAMFALVALSFAVIFVIAALLAHVATLALVYRDAILNAVRGEVTAGWALTGAYLLRITALTLFFSVGTSTVISAIALSEERNRSQLWAEMGSAYYMRIGGAVQDEQNGAAIDNSIGQWIRDADARHEVSLAWRLTPGSAIGGGPGRDVLVVNDKYLLDNEIYDAAGSRVRPEYQNAIRVLVPEQHAGSLPDLSAWVVEWAKFQASLSQIGELPPIRLGVTRSGQTVLTYARVFSEGDLALKDPIVIVVNAASGLIANTQYTSVASRGELLIEDPDRAMSGLAAMGVGPYILGVSPFGQEAADDLRKARREFGLQLFNLVAAVVVVLVTAFALLIVYRRRNAQMLFVKYICGWGLVRTHRWMLAAEGALVLTLMWWTWYRTTNAIYSYTMPGAPPPPPGVLPLLGWMPVLVGGVALLNWAIFVLAFLRTNASFVKIHSASLS